MVAFAGDGDFLMNGQELATAVQYGATIIMLVVNNGMYGTIRMHQEREYPGPRLAAPSCATRISPRYARAFGGHGETVERTAEFAPALRARARRRQAGAHRAAHRSRSDHARATLPGCAPRRSRRNKTR